MRRVTSRSPVLMLMACLVLDGSDKKTYDSANREFGQLDDRRSLAAPNTNCSLDLASRVCANRLVTSKYFALSQT